MVSSRSKTAAEAAANKRTTRSAAASGVDTKVPDLSTIEQESKKKPSPKKAAAKPASSKTPVSTASPVTKSSIKSRKKGGGTYCLCGGEDDGTPMIKCEGDCQNWYHFRCIELDEDAAGEIERYYCPDCELKTGLKTVMDFEGPDAFVEPPAPQPAAKKARSKTPAEELDVVDSPEETDGAGSEDDYVAKPSSKRAKSGKRTVRQLSLSSDKSDTEDDDDDSDAGRRNRPSKGGRLKRLKKASASPATESSSALKRRSSSAQQPTTKRLKTAESAQDDAIRKYCLMKLEEIIRPMFEEYQEAQTTSQLEGQGKTEESSENKEATALPSSIEVEKNALENKVKSFVNELERCMMETYAEPDKTGKPHAGGKYKERFRMLQFNLPKRDRVALRKGIASGRMTPAQLNVMSSTDLADEQTKHEIEMAEKEALEHSILQKMTAPRAKITHKGFETIEDVSGQRAVDAAKEDEERRMEMEKREREKLARLRTQSQHAGSPATATPQSPLSAVFPKASSPSVSSPRQPWGAPPPLPDHSLLAAVPPASPTTNRPSVRPLFMPSMINDYGSSEQGLSLDDIMNIDDDVSTKDAQPSNPQQRVSAQVDAEVVSSSSPIVTSRSGPSPFAPSRPAVTSPRRPSFDLNSLWTGPNREDAPADDDVATESKPTIASEQAPAEENAEEAQDEAMELDSNDDDERTLDAILEQSASAVESIASPAQQTSTLMDSLPEVWVGQITMPRENFDALAFDVSCKQVGGRTLEATSGYWQALFPSPQARIDGRVPTAQSAKYLVSIRMNSSKELIAVNFIPRSEEARARFYELIDFLIGKDRHALVFPWGTQPKPQAPGRELYLIPLLKDQPLPEFIELIDDHHVPRERTGNFLLGIFVLNKGKLEAAAPLPASFASPPMPTPFASLPVPGIPTVPLPTTVFAPPLPAAPSSPVKIDQAALAAEVASLTPEQISLMLRHLSQSVPLATSAGVPGPPTSAPSPPVPASAHTVPGMPPFPPQFPPSNQSYIQPPPGQFPPSRQVSPPHPQGHEERYFDNRDGRYREIGRDEYGGRGRGSDRGRRGHQRGRGKPFQDDRNKRPPPADSGWRGRGRGGPSR